LKLGRKSAAASGLKQFLRCHIDQFLIGTG
jgi:hypothetical protein